MRERGAGERRVAIVPEHIAALRKIGVECHIEAGAGEAAGYRDEEYRKEGATIAPARAVAKEASIIVGIAITELQSDVAPQREQLVIGYCLPYRALPFHRAVEEAGASAFAIESIPRITRAQSMDILSSMANISGYKAVVLAAARLPKLFPLMMTAAGTIVPCKTLVLGAGVAGLQAIATAKRLGAVVSAYDIRSEVKEQIESLGAHFVEVPLATEEGAGEGGYARQMDAAFYARQRELLHATVIESDVLICTAAVPGKKAPELIPKETVEAMRPGSIIVDIAAASGGNCAYTTPDEEVEIDGVTILGPTNLPATVASTASKLYSKNISAILNLIIKDGALDLNAEDEIVANALIIDKGTIKKEELKS